MNIRKITAQFFNLVLVLALAITTLPAQAAVPGTLNYQGQLTNAAGVPVNSPPLASITFKLYDAASGGNLLWSETQSVVVSNGLYSVTLGQTTPLTPALFGAPLYMGITVAPDTGEMTPRIAMSSSATALRASLADTATTANTATTATNADHATLADAATTASALASNATVAGSQVTGTLSNITISGATLVNSQLTGTATPCDTAHQGALRWVAATGAFEGCTGVAWVALNQVMDVLSVIKAGTGAGAVISSLAGISCGATCTASYSLGTSVTLTAIADATSTFTGWSGACTGTATCTVTMDAAKSVMATFSQIMDVLSVSKTGAGTVTSSPAGIYCGVACTASLARGTVVTLAATPDAGATFTGWGGVCTGSTATCTVTMDAAKSVTATFSPIVYVLSVNKAGTGAGVVTSSPAGISCGATCAASYVSGSSVTLTATPDATSTFAGWSGACTGTATCTVTSDAAKSVTATFSRNTYGLSVSKAGAGVGTVTSSPTGIDCGATCTASFDMGMFVTLTATPDAASAFTGWSGACTGSAATCTVTMNAAKSVTATFSQIMDILSVSKAGSGVGTVASNPASIYCGVACTASLARGTVVTLAATPDAGATFTGWGGVCTGSTATCTVTMDAAKSVTATFSPIVYVLSVNKAGTGAGVVTSSPAGISCGATCAASYVSGSSVTLTATPGAGSNFSGWTGACTSSAVTCTVTTDAAKSVTATFF